MIAPNTLQQLKIQNRKDKNTEARIAKSRALPIVMGCVILCTQSYYYTEVPLCPFKVCH